MNVRKSSLITAAVLCGLATTAYAQERSTRLQTQRSHAEASTGFCKASDLIGMEVRGTDNQDLGEVQDLFINRRTHEVEYLILDTGVLADLDGEQPIIPWMITDMRAGSDADTYYLSIPLTQERIKAAPTVVLGDVDLTRTPSFVADVDEFYSAELQERRVSRPDFDQNRENATPRSSRDADRSTRERQERNPDARDRDLNNPKPDAKPAPKQPTNP